MEILKRYIIIVLAALSLTSCYKEVDLSGISNSVLCLNSLIKTDEPIFITVSHTWFYSEYIDQSGNLLDTKVKDASVALYVNDEYVENLKLYTKEIVSNNYLSADSVTGYISNYCPKAGDRIRLVAESKDYGNAEATVVMPDQVAIDNLKYDVTVEDKWYYENESYNSITVDYTFDIFATFTDPEATTNYYIIDYDYTYSQHAVEDEDGDTEMQMLLNFGWIDSDVEPLLSEHISALESVFGAETYSPYFFSDMQISGISYPVHMRIRSNKFWTRLLDENETYDATLRFKLYNISEDYYKYLVYAWQVEDGMSGMLQDIGFGDSLVGYSNVSTNAGIVATITPTIVTINLNTTLKTLTNQALTN